MHITLPLRDGEDPGGRLIGTDQYSWLVKTTFLGEVEAEIRIGIKLCYRNLV